MNKVEIAGVNTANLPLLSTEEKCVLISKIKQGDEEARTEFIKGNLRLVLSVIQRFYGRDGRGEGRSLYAVGVFPPESRPWHI